MDDSRSVGLEATPATTLAGRRIVLGITGGIAAYKAAELCRLLVKAGATVRVVMTEAATEFITPLTMQTLSGAPVSRQLFDLAGEAEIGHIRLADEADLLIVAPATADAIARLAAGMANDLLTAVVLASKAPLLLAPAMNVNMWENPLTQANLGRLLGPAGGGRVSTVGPDSGELACGWIGAGRLIEPAEIVAAAARLLAPADLGRPAGGRHGRPDPRARRRRSVPRQPVVGEDGRRAGGGGGGARRRGDVAGRAGDAEGPGRRRRPDRAHRRGDGRRSGAGAGLGRPRRRRGGDGRGGG